MAVMVLISQITPQQQAAVTPVMSAVSKTPATPAAALAKMRFQQVELMMITASLASVAKRQPRLRLLLVQVVNVTTLVRLMSQIFHHATIVAPAGDIAQPVAAKIVQPLRFAAQLVTTTVKSLRLMTHAKASAVQTVKPAKMVLASAHQDSVVHPAAAVRFAVMGLAVRKPVLKKV